MRTISRAISALAIGSASAAYADFSWEIAGLVGRSERSPDSNFGSLESDVASVSGTYYLEAVVDGNGPPALASFLDPTTNVFVAASEEKQTEDIGFGTVIERETTDYTIGGTYVFPQSKWYAGGRYSSPETDEPLLLSRPGDVDETRYGVVAGTYFGTGATRLELSLDKLRLESEQSSGTGPPIGNDPVAGLFSSVQAETTVDEPRLEVMHVGRLRSATYALIGRVARKDARLRASYTLALPGQPAVLTDTAELDLVSDIYSVGGEIYPVPAVGVRLRYTREDGPVVSEQNTVDVAAGWFFRRNVGVELTLSSVDPEFVPRTEAGALRVIGRF